MSKKLKGRTIPEIFAKEVRFMDTAFYINAWFIEMGWVE